MVSYRYNLLALGISTGRYRTTANRALRTARQASAVDTGNFRKGWRVRLVGDFLFVENSVRYAAPVELGSIVHNKHKHKVRRALSRIGLNNGILSQGQGVRSTFLESQPVSRTVPPLTLQEIRSPALIRNRFRSNLPPKADLFKPAALAALILSTRQQQEQGETEDEPSQ